MAKPKGNEGISEERATGNAIRICIDYATRSKAKM